MQCIIILIQDTCISFCTQDRLMIFIKIPLLRFFPALKIGIFYRGIAYRRFYSRFSLRILVLLCKYLFGIIVGPCFLDHTVPAGSFFILFIVVGFKNDISVLIVTACNLRIPFGGKHRLAVCIIIRFLGDPIILIVFILYCNIVVQQIEGFLVRIKESPADNITLFIIFLLDKAVTQPLIDRRVVLRIAVFLFDDLPELVVGALDDSDTFFVFLIFTAQADILALLVITGIVILMVYSGVAFFHNREVSLCIIISLRETVLLCVISEDRSVISV